KKLKVTDIEPNREQARKVFEQEALEELADSIKEYGLIQPIVVTKEDGYYGIVAGERRWRASKLAGLTEIPAIIKNYDEKTNSEVSLIENMQRENLNPYEKALGIKSLIDNYGVTQEEIAKKIGKRRTTISNWLRVLNLDPRVLEMVKEGKLTDTHCKVLLSITDPDKQYKIALQAVEQNSTTKELERKTTSRTKLTTEEREKRNVFFRSIEDNFQSFFGTKVKINPGKRKRGHIVITYTSNDDLERFLDLIK
ncbi:MAG: ParB/RepB/Spo0J family partition protein, partial [Clostridia bacterium]|nr:ParB/RepB/Spo0J family partition protein [Clostridia bacterium]